jgi:CBS domain-containing protein
MTEKQCLRDVMTPDPIILDADATAADAARAMRKRDVGDVLVRSNGALCGIVTDRDLVVRALAEDPQHAAGKPLRDICSEAHSLAPSASVDEAVKLMSDKAIRRIPIVEDGIPVGIVSLGDLAVARDPNSALGEISAAPPNS